jgi:hypothetical protein
MAQIVLVHGIAQEQKGQEVVAADVKAPLISGIQNALGAPCAPREPKVLDRANDLINEIRTGGPAMLDAAFYGNLFLEGRTDSDDEKQLADSFAKAAMARARTVRAIGREKQPIRCCTSSRHRVKHRDSVAYWAPPSSNLAGFQASEPGCSEQSR